jgi:hypothetical protein
MNNIGTSYVLWLLPPKGIGNTGQSDYAQGVNFEQCYWEALGSTGDELDDEPHKLKDSDASV